MNEHHIRGHQARFQLMVRQNIHKCMDIAQGVWVAHEPFALQRLTPEEDN